MCRKSLVLLTVLACAALPAPGADKPAPISRELAQTLMKQGNWKEAYGAFSALALNPQADPLLVGNDLAEAVQCLRRLGSINEFDGFIEKVIEAHARNWRLLQAAARQYQQVDHQGSLIAGEFVRGPHRGGTAKYVNSFERDRVRALQLLDQAIRLSAADRDRVAVADLHRMMGQALMGARGFGEAWRLQYLTDLKKLPDYEEGYYGRYGGQGRGAPVRADGSPVYHYAPDSWEEAKTDGERWRWCLLQTMEGNAARRPEVMFHFASFLRNQFGVQTMAQHARLFRSREDDARKDESGTYALHTLGEEETIARLATGIQRFRLPDEFNFIRIWKELAAQGGGYAEESLNSLAQVFEDRRQYPKAADYWRRSMALRLDDWKQKRLDQILGNWGEFEPVMTQPAGQGATVEFRFRNGRKIAFEAYEIKVRELLDDIKVFLKSNPRQLDWRMMNIGDIGYRLAQEGQDKYVGAKVAEWALDLDPRPNHFDRRITVSTPLQKAGAYFLIGKMDGGNVSRIILWVADTAIIRKPLDQSLWCYVGDAVTGAPIARANVEFFGYRQEWKQNLVGRGGQHVVHTREFAEFTDADGQIVLKPDGMQEYQWVLIATTPDGRLAYHGFTGAWIPNYFDAEYNAQKVFVITDRPVYRPLQTVKFKVWVNQAQYDREGMSPFAGRTFVVQVNNPRGEKVYEKSLQADEYGGLHGELSLEKEATLGVYSLHVVNYGGGSFRVEEYKKPEFEVNIEAPTEPVMLGETISATVVARYYFGAPVANAKVKYKVLRSSHTAQWYPVCYWDWFYGPGYWWFAQDYPWYPGWREWGCRRPMWEWWGWRPQPPPELVSEVEVAIGPDGKVKVDIETALAKELMGDTDHRYEITAEVTDQSRRTIVGHGAVLVARKPFKVYAWVDRGHYRVGDVIQASFNAHTLDHKPIQGRGDLRLLRVSYDKNLQPVEAEVQRWALNTSEEGRAEQQIRASRAGQYRLSYAVTDSKGRTMEGGYVFVIRGEGYDGRQFRFNDIELVTDKREYKPGDMVELMINTEQADSTVLLFVRPANGVYRAPKVLRLKGKSVVEAIEVVKRDMPNFFVEGLTISGGKVHTDLREVIVPPESRVLDVEVTPSATEYKPGAPATVKVRLTEPNGEPYQGSVVLSMYDKSVEYISGGSNVPEIRAFFWKWRRHHRPNTDSSLNKSGRNLLRPKEIGMGFLGIFGRAVADDLQDAEYASEPRLGRAEFRRKANGVELMAEGVPTAPMAARALAGDGAALAAVVQDRAEGAEEGAPPMVEAAVRKEFADTALWVASLQTGKDGAAEVALKMPENLTTWKARVWAMGGGARCGEGSAEVVTKKSLIVRLQAPRFFMQKDEVVLSANVHNYLQTKKKAQVFLELDGGCLAPEGVTVAASADGRPARTTLSVGQSIEIEAAGERRVDWRVRVLQPGEAVVRVKALTDEESDAMEMKFPVYVHGMLKTESFSASIAPDGDRAALQFTVPAERRPEESRLEIRYSPSLAMAMVDALPYLADYPYGCTEQTLNRFLPAAITQKVLLDMGLDLKDIERKRANLNAQEIGDDIERAKQWKRFERNPVFDADLLRDMVKAGVERLTSMQVSDGGWGWFSGWGEQSYPHTTAVVVRGLQIAQQNDVAVVPGVLERGVEWLRRYEAEQVRLIRNAEMDPKPRRWKARADHLDAFVYMVLVDAGAENPDMRTYLYRDRNDLAVYAKAMFGLALHKIGDTEKRDMILRNIEQFLVQDDENQTAYLKLNPSWWRYWYGSEYEAHAYYLKLLAATDPKNEKARRLVKYLLNNRRNATYWNSTRDTALCVEAFADYIRAAGEHRPDMTVEVWLDGRKAKEVKIESANLFTYDNKLVLTGDEVRSGAHRVEVRKKGTGPLYLNAYLTNFTLEDPITKAGLEIKVERRYFRLVPVDKTVQVEGARGQAVEQVVEKHERRPIANLDALKSGDLVEIELVIESKNDYEYVIFEDMKAAGVEPVEVRSGYTGNEMGAYVEFRDERTVFFVRALARGKHSVSYRVRAEIPGRFSALPAKGSAMYAPELRANSDEFKIRIED